MKKYLIFARGIMQETFTYRLNFVMWRVRVVLQLLMLYFLWLSLLPPGHVLFGYSQSRILTYVLAANIIVAIAFSTRTGMVADEINSGDLSNSLIKPLNYFWRLFFIDIGDKAMNTFFSLIELTVLFFILRPPFFLQTNLLHLGLTILSVITATLIIFCIDILLGMIGFWSNETWAPRFIFGILLQFFSGGFFPLDILPKQIFSLFQATPFPYLLYFPLKIYLGQLTTNEIVSGFAISSFWMISMFGISQLVWNHGLKSYTAQGR